jgi:DNA polymerase
MDIRDLLPDAEFISSGVSLYHEAPFYDDLKSCNKCSARAEAQQVVPGMGPKTAEIIFVGRNPGGEEDKQGFPFVGRGGGELNRMCIALGIDKTKCGILNLVKCHTTGDRPPKKEEIQICLTAWMPLELAFFDKAKIIFPLGKEAVQSFLGPNAISPGKSEGYWVKVRGPGGREFEVCPLNHPGYILRARAKQIQMFGATLPKVKDYLITNFPGVYERSKS